MPAPLEDSAEMLFDQFQRLTPYFKSFQVDIADGKFVDNETLSIQDAKGVLSEFPGVTVDFHLMVTDWQYAIDVIETIDRVTVRYVLVHSKTNPPTKIFESRSINSFSVGLVINPDEEIDTIKQKYDLSKVPAIQIMTVYPGKQGQPFVKESLNKIDQLRIAGYKSDIFIDGAVNPDTIPSILSRKFSPDYAGIGSYLTRARNIQEAVNTLSAMEGVVLS